MDDLACLNFLGSIAQLREDGAVKRDLVVRNLDYQKTEAHSSHVLLVFKILVNGYENIEFRLSQRKKLAIGGPSPAHLDDRFDLMI